LIDFELRSIYSLQPEQIDEIDIGKYLG